MSASASSKASSKDINGDSKGTFDYSTGLPDNSKPEAIKT
jgi:hypothetical protein